MVREEANRSCNDNDNISSLPKKRACLNLNDESLTLKGSRH